VEDFYEVGHRYTASRDGKTFGPWEQGDVVALDQPDAEWVERDSPGTLLTIEVGDEEDQALGEDLTPELVEQAYELHAEWLAEHPAVVDPSPEPVEDEPVDEPVVEPAPAAAKPLRKPRGAGR